VKVQVKDFWPGSGRVRSATSESGKFPPQIPIFFVSGEKISSVWVKKYLGQPLVYCKSKVYLGRVGSGQGPSLILITSFENFASLQGLLRSIYRNDCLPSLVLDLSKNFLKHPFLRLFKTTRSEQWRKSVCHEMHFKRPIFSYFDNSFSLLLNASFKVI